MPRYPWILTGSLVTLMGPALAHTPAAPPVPKNLPGHPGMAPKTNAWTAPLLNPGFGFTPPDWRRWPGTPENITPTHAAAATAPSVDGNLPNPKPLTEEPLPPPTPDDETPAKPGDETKPKMDKDKPPKLLEGDPAPDEPAADGDAPDAPAAEPEDQPADPTAADVTVDPEPDKSTVPAGEWKPVAPKPAADTDKGPVPSNTPADKDPTTLPKVTLDKDPGPAPRPTPEKEDAPGRPAMLPPIPTLPPVPPPPPLPELPSRPAPGPVPR